MSTLPALIGTALVSILKKIGFAVDGQRGSYIFMKHQDGRATVIPVHVNETIGPGLFFKILRDVDLSREEFLDLFEKWMSFPYPTCLFYSY
jgi:predicted RNA binding protein YcfA (HicA-like mRNA interferase family)